jgi:hypothetical protein
MPPPAWPPPRPDAAGAPNVNDIRLCSVDDDAIRSLLTRLARAHPSGGSVVESAAIRAEGADFDAVMAWVRAHGGGREPTTAKASTSGLHGSRVHDAGSAEPRVPSRFVLPAGVLR